MNTKAETAAIPLPANYPETECDDEEVLEFECPDSDTDDGLDGHPSLTPLDQRTTRIHTPERTAEEIAQQLQNANQAPRCAHIKPSGMRCGSPAMRGIDFCYYHKRTHIGPRLMYPTMTMLEDGHGVQAALMEVLCGILDGALTDRQAALMLYGLQTAASNLKRVEDVDPEQVAVEPAPEEKLPEGVFERKRDEWSSQEKIEIKDFMQDMRIKQHLRQVKEAQDDEQWQEHLKRTAELRDCGTAELKNEKKVVSG